MGCVMVPAECGWVRLNCLGGRLVMALALMEVSNAFFLGSRSTPCNSEASSGSSRVMVVGCIFF